MLALGGGAVSYERGTPVPPSVGFAALQGLQGHLADEEAHPSTTVQKANQYRVLAPQGYHLVPRS